MNQMKVLEETPVFGLDIGTRSVVGTVGYKQGERFVVLGQAIREHQTRAMLDGQIHDINRVAMTIKEVKEELELQTGVMLREVCIAAAGRVLKTLDVHVDLEFEKEHNVTKEDLRTLSSLGIEKAFNEFQAKNESDTHFYCVGYSVVKYYMNHMWMAQPEHHKAKSIGADLIATFLPNDVVDGLYTAVELAGLRVANMTLEPIAAIRVAIPEKFRLLNIAMIDVGAGTSDISITNDGSVVSFGMIPYAGDALTESLAKNCLIDFVTAEMIKTAAATQAEITYEDIMGMEQTITAEEVLSICQSEMERMAKLTAEEIRTLNGGNAPSAVFIVGGGGKVKGFTEQIARELGLDPKRVALRGEEIMKEIDFPEGSCVDSTIVTPIGICLLYYEQNNNFVYVSFNGNNIKLYDNNKLAVMDAAIQASFSKEYLFPRRGDEIRYTVNGKNRVSKGEYGESAKIFVNGSEVNLNYGIKANDVIVVEESTKGKSAHVTVGELIDYNARINVTVDAEAIALPKPIKVNGVAQTADYEIQNGDAVSLYAYYTYAQMLEYLHVTDAEASLMINGAIANADAAVYDGDEILLLEKEQVVQSVTHVETEKQEAVHVFKNMIEDAVKEEQEEAVMDEGIPSVKDMMQENSMRLLVLVNQKPVALEGKRNYMFVDIFDYINFDTSKMQGQGIVTLVNGENAQYTQELHNGDKIEVFWK